MRKRFLTMLIILCMVLNCVLAVSAAETADETHQIEMKTYPFYLNSIDKTWPEEFPLYFADGIEDMPFVEVNDWADVLNWYFTSDNAVNYKDYQITVTIDEEKNQVFYLRDNDSFMIMDFDAGTILWDDYGKFMQTPNGDYMDLTGMNVEHENDGVYLLKTTGERVRYAQSTVLSLKDYSIPMIAQGGKYLLPLQTLSTFCLITVYRSVYFNQKCLILAGGMDMRLPDSAMNELMALITPDILEQVSAFASTPEEIQLMAVQMVTASEEGKAEELLLSVDKLFSKYPAITVSHDQEKRCRVGAEFVWEGGENDGYCRVYAPDGQFLMLGSLKSGRVKTVKSFFEVEK